MKPGTALGCLATLLLTVVPVATQAKWIEPGDKIELDGDEGLALFVVDSDKAISEVRLDRIGSIFSFPELKKLGAGRYLRLLKLPAGEYRFDSLRLDANFYMEYYWTFDDIPNSTFRIEAGKINYVGDVITRGGSYRTISIRDAELEAMESLDHSYPGLSQRFAVRYTGDFPDPFFEFLTRQKTKYAGTPAQTGPSLPKPSLVQRDLAEILFREFEVQAAVLSPSGKFVVEDATDGSSKVTRLINIETGVTRTLYSGPRQLADLEWISANRLVFTYWDDEFKSNIVDLTEGGEYKVTPIQRSGYVLGLVPGGNGQAIFAESDSSGWSLHAVDMTGVVDKHSFDRKHELHADVADDIAWVLDSKGVPRIAQIKSKDNLVLQYFPDTGSSYRIEIEDKANESFGLAGFDANNGLLVLTNRGREQIELVAFDPARQALGDTVFRKPGIDVSSVVLGRNREVVGVSYFAAGRLLSEYFAPGDQALNAKLRAALPGQSVQVDAESSAGKRMVRAFGPTDPGSFYVFDEKTGKLDLISALAPHLEGRPMLNTQRIVAHAADGFEIESFLTRKRSNTALPLLVIPHGGPVGVFDMKRFDPEVQYFAQLGYAVLQVNYRGSGNVGSSAQKAGFGQRGKGIESDVNAAVDAVIAASAIDTSRIVALGTSYGGYSAIMLSVLWPDRYKAAVSIAGVSDIPLRFSSGDVTFSRKSTERLVEMMGDPRTQMDSLTQVSPVYRFEDIQRPLLLVHDRGDQRVTYEHARRLQMLLTLRNKPAYVISVNDGEHGLVNAATAVASYPKIAAFLEQALSNGPAPKG